MTSKSNATDRWVVGGEPMDKDKRRIFFVVVDRKDSHVIQVFDNLEEAIFTLTEHECDDYTLQVVVRFDDN